MSDATVEVRVLTPGQRSACSDMQKRIDRQNAEIDRLREKLREAKAERDIQVGRALDLRAELAALRERVAVPVKVRWDEGWTHTENAYRDYRYEAEKAGALPMGPIQWAMNHYLAAHAVIDVPAGVPSMEELEQLVISTYCSHDGKRPPVWHRIATAIRDRILAGLAAANQQSNEIVAKLAAMQEATRNHSSGTFGAVASENEVDALARVMKSTYETERKMPQGYCAKEDWPPVARAAIAHLRKRPEGLPTAEELIPAVGTSMNIAHDEKFSPYSERGWEYTRAILAALAPWLRDPVGWELDVTAEQLRGHCITSDAVALLGFLRARIKPAFECKECAIALQSISDLKLREEHVSTLLAECEHRIDTARAALEGE